MAQQDRFDRSSDDVRYLSRHEIISATVSDALVMIASIRTTLLAGGIAGAVAPLAFVVPVALAVALWPILNSLMVALMAGALLFAIVLTPLVILSGFSERLRTVPVIEVAAALILLVVVIIAILTIRNTPANIGPAVLLGIVLTVVTMVLNLSPVVIGAGALGALMGLLRRHGALRDAYWRITLGPIVSSYFGPHQILSFIAVPVGIMVALAATIRDGWQLALTVFPIWFMSGILFSMYWELAHLYILGKITGRAAWFRKSVALAKVLEDDSYLFGLRFESVGVDPERGVAQIRAEFRDPDQVYRARQVCMRVAGIVDAEVVDTSDPYDRYRRAGTRY